MPAPWNGASTSFQRVSAIATRARKALRLVSNIAACSGATRASPRPMFAVTTGMLPGPRVKCGLPSGWASPAAAIVVSSTTATRTMATRGKRPISAPVAPVPARTALEPEPAVAEVVLAPTMALALRQPARAAQLASRLAVAGAGEHEARLLCGQAAAAEQEAADQRQRRGEPPHCPAASEGDNLTPCERPRVSR